MIPLRSSERTTSPAIVTLLLIVANVLVFLYELSLQDPDMGRSDPLSLFIVHYGIVPYRFHWSSLLTSMFIHGGFMHIAGNMLFLWVFGKAIEDLLGHGRFLLFYLACGVAAGLAHMLLNFYSPVPTVGTGE